MNLKNKKAKNSLKNLISGPLIIVMMGIFLLPKTAYLSTITPENIIKLTNKERNSEGLANLTENSLLDQAATDKAKDLFVNQVFQHDIKDKKFSAWIKNTGYEYSYVGENLAIDFVSSEGVIKAWLNSPSHRKNLLNTRFSEIGVAVLENKFQGDNTIIVVQVFGAPLVEKNNLNTEIKNPENLLSASAMSTENLLTDKKENEITKNQKIKAVKSQKNFPIALVTLFSSSLSFALFQSNLLKKKIKQ